MLNLGGNDMIPFLLQGKEDSFDRMVVGLAPSAGKDDLARITMEKVRYLLSGILNSFFGRHSCPVKA